VVWVPCPCGSLSLKASLPPVQQACEGCTASLRSLEAVGEGVREPCRELVVQDTMVVVVAVVVVRILEVAEDSIAAEDTLEEDSLVAVGSSPEVHTLVVAGEVVVVAAA